MKILNKMLAHATRRVLITLAALAALAVTGVGGFALGRSDLKLKLIAAREDGVREASAQYDEAARAAQVVFEKREAEARRVEREAAEAENNARLAEVRENHERLSKYAKALAVREKSQRDRCELNDLDAMHLAPRGGDQAATAPTPPRRPFGPGASAPAKAQKRGS